PLCGRRGRPGAGQAPARLFSGEAAGLLVRLPGWRYPVVVDIATGEVRFDNYEGRWGERQHLDRFLQLYAVEKCRIEARKKGLQVSEQTLQDGSIRLSVVEGS